VNFNWLKEISKTYISLHESPMIMPPIEGEGEGKKPILGRPVKGFGMMVDGILKVVKPKKFGSVKTDSGNQYTFHHHSSTSTDPFADQRREHKIFIADSSGTIVGAVTGSKLKKEEGSEHIRIETAAIDPSHRGNGLYGHALKSFVKKFPHVLHSDIVQTPAAAEAWKDLAKTAEEQGLDFRVHPKPIKSGVGYSRGYRDIHPGLVHAGIPWNKELDPGLWATQGTGETTIRPEDMTFSLRRRSS
jgi:hypothetical protein